MAQTTAKKAPAARKRAPAKKSAVAKKTTAKKTTAQKTTAQIMPVLDRTAEMSENVLKSVENAQKAAIEAVRKFVDTLDGMAPAIGDPAGREEIIDAALDMADKLVTTQYEFLRGVVHNADRSLRRTVTPRRRASAHK